MSETIAEIRARHMDELKKLLKAGTPTPWFVGGVRFKMNGGEWHGIMSYNEAKKQDDNVCLVGYDPRTGEGHADARLICAAVNALPGLLARVKRLEAIETAARTYFNGYMQDEAADDGPEMTGCGMDQHVKAAALRAALKEPGHE